MFLVLKLLTLFLIKFKDRRFYRWSKTVNNIKYFISHFGYKNMRVIMDILQQHTQGLISTDELRLYSISTSLTITFIINL